MKIRSRKIVVPTNMVGNHPLSSPSVLVVEDDEANRALLSHVLESEGYRVHAERDGEADLSWELVDRALWRRTAGSMSRSGTFGGMALTHAHRSIGRGPRPGVNPRGARRT